MLKHPICIAVCLLCASTFAPALGAGAIPDFSPDSVTGWIAGVQGSDAPVGQDYLPPISGPGPVTFDKAHPYVDDGRARRTG